MQSAQSKSAPVHYALFDFDGTISTLRQGWESVMEPLMLKMIAGPQTADKNLRDMIREYIDQSTGIQTIEQMVWLVGKATKLGLNPNPPADPWKCKAIYINRLHDYIRERRKSLEENTASAESFLVAGSREWLEFLSARNINLYLASGTDEKDVRYEASLLGVNHYFQKIAGARPFVTDCAKEKVISMLLEDHHVPPSELVVFGDGPVEIRIGRQIGARTVGIASKELEREGIDERKRQRLEKAGADIIRGDFQPASVSGLRAWLGLDEEME